MTWERLDVGARRLFYMQAAARWLLVWSPGSLVVGVAGSWGGLGLWGWGLGAVIWIFTFIQAIWAPWILWERFEFCIVDDVLRVRRGWWFRRSVALPLRRVQHIDMGRGFWDQALGLARIEVYTASGGGADASIPGLTLERAEALRDQILLRIRQSPPDFDAGAGGDGR